MEGITQQHLTHAAGEAAITAAARFARLYPSASFTLINRAALKGAREALVALGADPRDPFTHDRIALPAMVRGTRAAQGKADPHWGARRRRIPIPPLPTTDEPVYDCDDESPVEAARLDTGAPR